MSTKIELTEYEAESFVLFQKYRELFEALERTGVFNIRGGSCTIHFSSSGDIS